MFKKRYAILVLLSLLICMVAISSVSAAEDIADDNLTVDEITVDEVAIDDSTDDAVLNSEEDNVIVGEQADDAAQEILAVDDNDEEISASPAYDQYNVEVDDVTVHKGDKIVIPITIDPCNTDGDYAYDFYLKIFDNNDNERFYKNIYSYEKVYFMNYDGVDSSDLGVGTYTIKIINYKDSYEMDSATLTILKKPVKNAKITIAQSGKYYNKVKLTVKAVNSNTKAAIKNCVISIKFSNGKTANVKTNSKGIAKYKVPFVGTFTVQAKSISESVKGQSGKKKIKILKHPGKLTIKQYGKYYKSKKIKVKLVDRITKKVVKGQKVKIKFSNGKTVNVKTNSKGLATYKVKFKPGKYKATASVSHKYIKFAKKKLSKVKINKVPVRLESKRVKTSYDSGKKFVIKVINRATGKPIKGVKVKVKIRGGKTLTKTSGSGGKIKIDATRLSIGTHRVVMKVASKKFHTGKTKANKIIIKKAGVYVYAPDSVNCYKQKDEYSVRVTNGVSGHPVKGVKVTMKVFTGKKYKKYTVRTDSYGYASFSTKSLSKGKHKVTVSVKGNKHYRSGKGEGSVQISKKIPTTLGYNYPLKYYASYSYVYGMYGTSYVYGIAVSVYLHDKQGNELYKPVTLTHSNGNTASGTSGESIYISGTNSGQIYINFAGDKKYMASTCTVYLT